MSIDYSIACRLRDSLTEHCAFSDFHSISPADLAVRVIHEAGLHTAYIPLAATTRKDCRNFDMWLAIVDPRNHNHLCLSIDANQPTKVYALTPLRPMTKYVGELHECCLTKLWWAAPLFFYDLATVLTPGWQQLSDHEGGRSGWGHADRTAFAKAFDQAWTPDHSIEPATTVPVKKLRFATVTTLPLPAPAPAGES
jgi:hypothetical protein